MQVSTFIPPLTKAHITHTQIEELYWRTIAALTLPERRHYSHTDDLEDVIYDLMMAKGLIELTLTRQHEAALVRVCETWVEADYGFTFGPVAPPPRQPPPPSTGASAWEVAVLAAEWKRLADRNAYLPTWYAKWQTLDDITTDPTDPHRKFVVAIQNILPDESVARCLEAMLRTGRVIPETITWLGQTARR